MRMSTGFEVSSSLKPLLDSIDSGQVVFFLPSQTQLEKTEPRLGDVRAL